MNINGAHRREMKNGLVFTASDAALDAQLASLSPTNPLCTPQYFESMRDLGRDVVVIGEAEAGSLIWGAFGILFRGRLNQRLHIASLDTRHCSRTFWTKLLNACRRRKISELSIGSFSSCECVVPKMPEESNRDRRCEYVLQLQNDDLWGRLSSNHKRNVKRALKDGVRFGVSNSTDACRQHLELQWASMARRQERGESVPLSHSSTTLEAFIRAGAGRIYHAILDKEILSSVFILRSKEGAYYQSAGTNPRGMMCGAAHALVYEICVQLREQQLHRFSLGGVNKGNSGLERFKSGFGASPKELDSVNLFLGGALRKQLTSAVRGFRKNLA